ncbi:DEAD/DEAH box helicase family protein [Halovivax gelatinilyticus]|uniref:DEAD/DEAH box helicase family protein n=1 Tax=Halovivax gelatinilyticus TaxID=2961597 RepID=UPI0020CA301C|nr:DEAD/DEAH box helicase family protein [Halovivax gelatinilyticus]
MALDPFKNQIDERTSTLSVSEQFHQERLDRDDITTADWPSQIDRAATDLLLGIALGHSDSKFDHGGTIGTIDFGRATGGYYVDGLIDLSSNHSDLPGLIQECDETDIGNFVLALAKLRHALAKVDDGGIHNIDRAIEAIVEKLATRGMGPKNGRLPLHEPQAVVDIVYQLFSDPSASEYTDELIEALEGVRRSNADIDLLDYLDRPQMVTPLWDHQQDALSSWCAADYAGYVNMATATGKTVLGLGAIAHLFGELHPRDEEVLASQKESSSNASVLIVAGQDLLLEQWQSEFDEHLNIPRDRTQTGTKRVINLSWGTIEFRTAQDLLSAETVSGYDLVILDEAHRYRRGGRDGRSWRDLFDDLTDRSDAILAMSGSIDQDWIGDAGARDALEANLTECATFTIPEARKANVIADFSWEVTYAASAEDETLDGVTESTQPLAGVYDPTNHKFLTTGFGDVPDIVPETFETLRDLRSFAQSNDGSAAREQSAAFDRIATAAFSRRPRRWQLSPPHETVRRLVDRHVAEAKCIVLVQSYEQATQIGDVLRDNLGDDVVTVADGKTTSQSEQINEFKERKKGVIVGPGEVIGVGVDIPDADVAVNLSKGGVNASLIQRIGRVLRNPTGASRAHFYQVVTLPATPDGQLAGEDGRRLLRRASELRALGSRFRELPGFSTVDETTVPLLAELEVAGSMAMEADHRAIEEIVDDDVAQEWLYELLDAIKDRNRRIDPTLPQVWTGETVDPKTEPIRTAIESREQSRKKVRKDNGRSPQHLDASPQEYLEVSVSNSNDEPVIGASVSISTDEKDYESETAADGTASFHVPTHSRRVEASVDSDGYEPKEAVSLLYGRSGPYNFTVQLSSLSSEGDSVDTSHTEDSPSASSRDESTSVGGDAADPSAGKDGAVAPSELTELYEVFHSYRKLVDTLIEASGIEEGPMVTWRDTLVSFLDSGLEGWDSGYGPQQLNRSGIISKDYRSDFGNGKRVTEFQVIETASPSPLLDGILSHFDDHERKMVPVVPSSGTALPVIVETESALTEAQELLEKFPELPRVGNPPDSPSDSDLTTVSGVTDVDANVLEENGFENVADLREAAYEDIAAIPEIPDHLALRIKADVE